MNYNFNTSIYLDANFLIAYSGHSVKQPLVHKRAKILFAKLLAEKRDLVVSPLVFDEAWFGIRKEIAPKKILNKSRMMVSKLFNRIGLRLVNEGIVNFSCFEIIDQLKLFTNMLLRLENFRVVQFQNQGNGIRVALKNIENFQLKPRDAFHLSYMNDNGINILITRDRKDFFNKYKKMKIKIITF